MQDRNNEDGIIPSIRVSKFEEVVHTESDSHAIKVESDFHYDRNMMVHYNRKNVVHVQESYMYLPEAKIYLLP